MEFVVRILCPGDLALFFLPPCAVRQLKTAAKSGSCSVSILSKASALYKSNLGPALPRKDDGEEPSRELIEKLHAGRPTPVAGEGVAFVSHDGRGVRLVWCS